MASFFYCGRLSSAQLYCWQAPKQWPIIDPHPVEQIAYRRDITDNGYKSVFTKSWMVLQRNRSWIKGLGKKKEWTHSLTAVPFVRGHITVSTRTLRNVIPRNVTPRVACWHGSRQNSQKKECVWRRPPICGWKTNCGFIRHPMWTG